MHLLKYFCLNSGIHVVLDLFPETVPLNSFHIYLYFPLLLYISLRGFDSFQVGQQQASFFQHTPNIILKQKGRWNYKTLTKPEQMQKNTNQISARSRERELKAEGKREEWVTTFICRYRCVCECSRNSMALASSGSSVSDSSDPKPCSSWAISFTVTAKVSMDCRHAHFHTKKWGDTEHF